MKLKAGCRAVLVKLRLELKKSDQDIFRVLGIGQIFFIPISSFDFPQSFTPSFFPHPLFL